MFKRIIKAVKRTYDYFFKEDVPKVYENVLPFVRPVPAPVPVVPAPVPVAVVTVAPVVPAPVARDLKKEYKSWCDNMKDYDMIRQKLAQ
jgi:hypothetical protein